MSERDIEKDVPKQRFIETLRRIADALEKGESFRIQVGGERLTIPADAHLSVEHEREDDEQEVELQFRWAAD
jgi:amphi-Trp domain-containing protein